MPRYHFNIYDGSSQLDLEGIELSGIRAAREEAVRLAGELLRDGYEGISEADDWRMEVTDDRGLILFRLDFTMMDASAVSGGKPKTT